MNIDFTNLALAIIFIFGVFGWVRGIRRTAVATAGIFFGMTIISLIGQDLIVSLARVGVRFHPATNADLFLAALFAFTVYAVQLFGVRVILGSGTRPADRRERVNGMLLGLVNGFLVVANTMRYADPFVQSTLAGASGGWRFQLLLPHFTHPDAGTFSLTVAPTTVTVTPSPLLRIYDSLPTALILLFAFLVFVFLGTVYGRVMRSRR
jgi:hypothetical protein